MKDYDFIDPDLPEDEPDEEQATVEGTSKLLEGDTSRFLVDDDEEEEEQSEGVPYSVDPTGVNPNSNCSGNSEKGAGLKDRVIAWVKTLFY
jgi:hypothetical protein